MYIFERFFNFTFSRDFLTLRFWEIFLINYFLPFAFVGLVNLKIKYKIITIPIIHTKVIKVALGITSVAVTKLLEYVIPSMLYETFPTTVPAEIGAFSSLVNSISGIISEIEYVLGTKAKFLL